uniref:SEFIR domain-containing protein n=1 Tax=Kryptolebias marmoratus TaxID=37003 RepID=A0A3Q3AGK2_KRYMA
TMWRKILLFLCYVACQVTSHEIVNFPPVSITASPSEVAGLEVVQITKGEELKLNISWAINIDASIDYLTGTWFEISGEPRFFYKNLLMLKVNNFSFTLVSSSSDKRCIPCSASYLTVRSSPVVPVSVLVVYPAENSVFQHAVVALAEFLQLHGSCRVAIDLWQQGKIAELGPLRWLAEQVKAADRILIVSPQGDTSSSLHSQSIPNHSLPEHSIPATAHDLYPLILNMVASHAKSASEMTKFWVMHLNKKPCVFLPELKACKSFCLMKDLNKFCKSLHSPGKVVKKISSLLLKPGVSYSKNSTTKLREAIGMLEGCKSSLSREILIGDL